MKKMATLFQSWKKTLYKKFILKNDTPDFNAKAFVKLESYWDDFVEYKTSQESEERVMRNHTTTEYLSVSGVLRFPRRANRSAGVERPR